LRLQRERSVKERGKYDGTLPVRLEVNGKETMAIFNHIDGMYSHIRTDRGEVVHLNASTPMIEVNGAFEIDFKESK